MQDFVIFDDYGEFAAQMSAWFQVGTIKFREDIVDGLERAPQASSACWKARISASCWTRSYIDVLHKAFRQELHTSTFLGCF